MHIQQGMCLVLACSARLDAATLEDIVVSDELLKDERKKVDKFLSRSAVIRLPLILFFAL